MTSAVLDYPFGELVDYSDTHGVSDEADQISEYFQKTNGFLRTSFTFGNQREELHNKLIDAWTEASTNNWDGYGAMRANERSVAEAFQVIDRLPRYIPKPEIAIDPDGDVSLDWYGGQRRQFSISIGQGSVISYAGLFGSDNVRGRERLEGSVVPREIVRLICRAAG